MKNAIQKAIEGGWKGRPLPSDNFFKDNQSVIAHRLSYVFMDKTFWEALGLRLGWGTCKKCEGTGYLFQHDNLECDECGHSGATPDWQQRWHQFIDHLIEGKNPEDFFSELIK